MLTHNKGLVQPKKRRRKKKNQFSGGSCVERSRNCTYDLVLGSSQKGVYDRKHHVWHIIEKKYIKFPIVDFPHSRYLVTGSNAGYFPLAVMSIRILIYTCC